MKIKERLGRLCLAAGMLALAGEMRAAQNPVHWSVPVIPQKPVRPGAAFTAKLLAAIDPGWHLYALDQEEGGPISTEISLAEQSFLTLGTIRASKPIQLFDQNFNKRVALYVDKAEFALPLVVSASATQGPQHTAIEVRFQCCNDAMCLPPRTAAVDLAVTIRGRR